ncbi:MAG: glycosyltransferase family 2 protein [Sporocytophaga sp.]|uniref:glycosyltransferase family 2 protein n=1 Tax=Sporocytophaga sp. TaxID=2231183 RepID=UPI001B0D1AF1|nr:glycosyltransferase family 2 protein [Sporocytophaga sp.]MBO9698623.1 glycosyltransferase family 2 protein [Sporocytophaga sp.]
MAKYLVSVVVPLFNEEENVFELVHELVSVMNATDYSYQILLVNDGSRDNTWSKIQALAKGFKQIEAINLAGNYGQTMALRAGFEQASGEIIVAMDGDLQHDPQYIPVFIEEMQKGNYDMVGGAKIRRPESAFKNFLAETGHKIIKSISGVNLRYFGATFKAYRSYLLQGSNMLGDSHRFLGAIVARKGTRYTELPIEIRERKRGKSNYKISKVFLVILDLLFLKFFISYINKPFRIFGLIGLINFLIGIALTTGFTVGSLFFHMNIKEHYLAEFLFSVFLMLIGTMFLSIGIIAEIGVYNYFQKSFAPPYRVREVITDEKIIIPLKLENQSSGQLMNG